MLSVCEIASVHLRLGGRSIPPGKGGSVGAVDMGTVGRLVFAAAS